MNDPGTTACVTLPNDVCPLQEIKEATAGVGTPQDTAAHRRGTNSAGQQDRVICTLRGSTVSRL